MADETNPINGNDLGAVAESLIMDTPTNPEPEVEEVVEATEDTQTEAIEDAEVIEDAIEASDDSEDDMKLFLMMRNIVGRTNSSRRTSLHC